MQILKQLFKSRFEAALKILLFYYESEAWAVSQRLVNILDTCGIIVFFLNAVLTALRLTEELAAELEKISFV